MNRFDTDSKEMLVLPQDMACDCCGGTATKVLRLMGPTRGTDLFLCDAACDAFQVGYKKILDEVTEKRCRTQP